MKKVINFFTVIFMATFLLSAQNSLAQSSCPPDAFGCTDEIETASVMSVPGFPECIITVKYKFRVCQGVFQVYDTQIQEFDFDMCSEWINYLLELYFGEGGEVAFQSYIRKLNKEIGGIILDELAQSVALQGDPAPYYCGTGVKTITGSYYPGGCISTCIGQKEVGGQLIYRQVSCKGDLCCG